ncbi:hypothetical protein HYV82_03315 [Candidatus Woesearchaeota archaeon]|nr:hypothetical protein [Candidatus Woesearchaeota archaeon]
MALARLEKIAQSVALSILTVSIALSALLSILPTPAPKAGVKVPVQSSLQRQQGQYGPYARMMLQYFLDGTWTYFSTSKSGNLRVISFQTGNFPEGTDAKGYASEIAAYSDPKGETPTLFQIKLSPPGQKCLYESSGNKIAGEPFEELARRFAAGEEAGKGFLEEIAGGVFSGLCWNEPRRTPEPYVPWQNPSPVTL